MVMKTNFNPIGIRAVLVKGAAFVWLLAFLAVGVAAFQKPLVTPVVNPLVVVNLPAGVTGVEIQKALDRLPPAGGEVVLPAGILEVAQPIVLARRPSCSWPRARTAR